MKHCILLAIIAILAMHGAQAYWEAGCQLEHEFVDKFFNCTVYQSNNVTDGEYSMRIDVCFVEDGANSVCESIIQRFDRTLGANLRSSSQMIIGEPWTPWRQCCQHDALGTTPRPSLTPSVGETLNIVRSDNFTVVRITSVNLNPTIDINSVILNHWDDAELVCDLKCTATVDAMFNIDNSGSINGNEFNLMVGFIRSFIDAFTISLSKTNLGLVLFNGFRNSNSVDDHYYIVNQGSNVPFTDGPSAQTYFDVTAVTDPTWASRIAWQNGTLNPTTDYYFWVPSGVENSGGGGYAFLELYLSPFEFEIQAVLNKFGNGQSRFMGIYTHTAMGTGLTLCHHLFYRNGNRPVANVGDANGFPKLLLTLADGGNNRGMSPAAAAAIGLTVPNITLIGIGIGTGVKQSEITAVSSPQDGQQYFNYTVSSFSETQFNAVLTPLISGSCLGQSNNAVPCGASCNSANGMCTACGDCIQCLSDDDCPSCGFCAQSPFGSCVVDETAAISKCSAPTACQTIVCDPSRPRDDMCVVIYNDTSLIETARANCIGADGLAPFTFDDVSCLCTANPAEGDGGVSGAAIAGGAVAGAVALLIILAILAALLLLLLVAALFIIIAVVVAAIVMLAFGVTMAIPPSITALEVTAPNQVVNEENPLAVDQMEWVESAAQDA